MNTTPILVLIFNRPDKAKGLFDIIRRQKPMKLYVAADGPRKDRHNEEDLCLQARAVFNNIDWPCEVKTFFRDENAGCGRAVREGITGFFRNEECERILEDDCHPHDDFFPFCQEMLAKYRHDNRVKIISGTNFQQGIRWGSNSYYFSHLFHVWGWATWRRSWNEYCYNMDDHDDSLLKEFKKRFPNSRLRQYWEYIFRMMKTEPVDTWDYQLFFSIVKNNGLTIIPNTNLVSNIGFGDDATHTQQDDPRWSEQATHPLGSIKHPTSVRCNNLADTYYYYNNELNRKPRIFHRIRRAMHWY